MKVIAIQPFGNFSPQLVQNVFRQIWLIDSNVILLKDRPLPASAFYAPRNRYRADSLISVLSKNIGNDTIIIGLTEKDISTRKGYIQDWGVMGLGYCPGNACIVSTYRLDKSNLNEQFFKVAIHELGHTQGLPHCPNKTCFMRDAEGGNKANEEADFCSSCKAFLRKKGWILN
ncbi:matrixin family metalloprotease [Chitinophagaceae bacterium LWZ2-11]